MDFKEFDSIACTHCGAAAEKRCGTCPALYCSQRCQKQDWGTHVHEHRSPGELKARRRQLFAQRIGKLPAEVKPVPLPAEPKPFIKPFPPLPRYKTGNPVWDKMNIPREMLDALVHYDRSQKEKLNAMYESLQDQSDLLEKLVREYMNADQHKALDAASMKLQAAAQKYASMQLKPYPKTTKMTEVVDTLSDAAEAISNTVSDGQNLHNDGKAMFEFVTEQFNRAVEHSDCTEQEEFSKRPRAPDVSPMSVNAHQTGGGDAPSLGPHYTTTDGVFVQSSQQGKRFEIKKLSPEAVQSAQNRDFNGQLASAAKWATRFAEIDNLEDLSAAYKQFESEFRGYEARKQSSDAYQIRNTSFRQQQSTEAPAADIDGAVEWLRKLVRDIDRNRRKHSENIAGRSRSRGRKGVKGQSGDESEEESDEEEEDDWGDFFQPFWEFLLAIKGATGKAALITMALLYMTGSVVMPDVVGTGPSTNLMIENEYVLADMMVENLSRELSIYAEGTELGGWIALQNLLEDQGDLFHAAELARLDEDAIHDSQYEMALDMPNTPEMVSEFGPVFVRSALTLQTYALSLRASIAQETGLDQEDSAAQIESILQKLFGDQVLVLQSESSSTGEKTEAMLEIESTVKHVQNAGFWSMWAESVRRWQKTDEPVELPQDPKAFIDKTIDAIFNKTQFNNETLTRVLLTEDMDKFYEMINLPWTELPKILAPTQIQRNLRPQTVALYQKTIQMFPDSQLMGDMAFSMFDLVTGISRTESLQLEVRRYLGRFPDAMANFQEHDSSHIKFIWAAISWSVWFWAWTYVVEFFVPRARLAQARRERHGALEANKAWFHELNILGKLSVGPLVVGASWMAKTMTEFSYQAERAGNFRWWDQMQRFSMKALLVTTLSELTFWTAAVSRHLLFTSIPNFINAAIASKRAMITMGSGSEQYEAIVRSTMEEDDVSSVLATGIVAIQFMVYVVTAGTVSYLSLKIIPRLANATKYAWTERTGSRSWRRTIATAKVLAVVVNYQMAMQGIGYIDNPLTLRAPVEVGPDRFDYDFSPTALRQSAENEQWFLVQMPDFTDLGEDVVRLQIGDTLVQRRFNEIDWEKIVMQAALQPGGQDVLTIRQLRENYQKIQREALERRRKKEEKKKKPPPRKTPKALPKGTPKEPPKGLPEGTPPKRQPGLPRLPKEPTEL